MGTLSMKLKEVKYVSDYSIEVVFDDGVRGIVHLNDLVEKGIFKVLQDKKRFAQVYATPSAIAWSDQLEIDALKIYFDLTGKSMSLI
jgi:hypothetical protein